MQVVSSPVQGLSGTCEVPGDKSISHRAVIFSAIAQGRSRWGHFLSSADCIASKHALNALGVYAQADQDELWVEGVGLHGLQAPQQAIDCGNSGTSMRLLTGLLCGQHFSSTLVGDASLSKRPMRRVSDPLCQMGADIGLTEQETAPIEIHSVQQLQGIHYCLPIASAQIKSALLIAGLYAHGITQLSGKIRTRDHTERMLQSFGGSLTVQGEHIMLEPGEILHGQEIDIPGDLSSAAFFIVAASLVPGAVLSLKNVGVNTTRDGVLRILQQMGANIQLRNHRRYGAEPVADIEIQSSSLTGINIPEAWVANAIDELPIVLIAAACAQGVTQLRGAEELRHKESDRIDAMAQGLRACGITVETQDDGMVVHGSSFTGGPVDSFGDHRIAMAFIVAGLVSQNPVTVRNCENINTSFPGFMGLSRELGFDLCQSQTQ